MQKVNVVFQSTYRNIEQPPTQIDGNLGLIQSDVDHQRLFRWDKLCLRFGHERAANETNGCQFAFGCQYGNENDPLTWRILSNVVRTITTETTRKKRKNEWMLTKIKRRGEPGDCGYRKVSRIWCHTFGLMIKSLNRITKKGVGGIRKLYSD